MNKNQKVIDIANIVGLLSLLLSLILSIANINGCIYIPWLAILLIAFPGILFASIMVVNVIIGKL